MASDGLLTPQEKQVISLLVLGAAFDSPAGFAAGAETSFEQGRPETALFEAVMRRVATAGRHPRFRDQASRYLEVLRGNGHVYPSVHDLGAMGLGAGFERGVVEVEVLRPAIYLARHRGWHCPISFAVLAVAQAAGLSGWASDLIASRADFETAQVRHLLSALAEVEVTRKTLPNMNGVLRTLREQLDQDNLNLRLPMRLYLRRGIYPLTAFDLDIEDDWPFEALEGAGIDRDDDRILPNARDRALQIMLNGVGASVETSGLFDKKTGAAVRALQRTGKLRKTGVVDADTAQLIRKLHSIQHGLKYIAAPVPLLPKNDKPRFSRLARTRAKADVDIDDLLGSGRDIGYSAPGREPPASELAQPAAPSDRVQLSTYAPKRFSRIAPELVSVAVFRKNEKRAVKRAIRQRDPRAGLAADARVGQIRRGQVITVLLGAINAVVDTPVQRAEWTGEFEIFSFPVLASPHEDAERAVITAKIAIDDVEVASVTFVRPIRRGKGKSEPKSTGQSVKLPKRVFLSYNHNDMPDVAQIYDVYSSLGIRCFFDRASLLAGEEWTPRLFREIDAADRFVLCWSRNAAGSEWVEKEAVHADQRNKRSWRRRPEFTVKMLDGPPFAPPPPSLSHRHFDDRFRAELVGRMRGDGHDAT